MTPSHGHSMHVHAEFEINLASFEQREVNKQYVSNLVHASAAFAQV